MKRLSFKEFIINEDYADFGFDPQERRSPVPPADTVNDDDLPTVQVNIEYLCNLLAAKPVGLREGKQKYFSVIEWGDGPGSIRVRIGTRCETIIERLQYDLEGNPIWATKRTFCVNRRKFHDKEAVIAKEIHEELKEINELPLESPSREYKELPDLIRAMASGTARSVNDPLFYEGVKKINDNNYIIYFGAKGQGVGEVGQRRIEEVLIDVSFNPKTGVIKLINGEVESPLKQRTWEMMPSDYILHYMPSQSRDEIVNTIATLMKYY